MTFADRVEVGIVAVNSAERTLSAELEMLNIEDPQGSMARDYADPPSEDPSRPPPASSDAAQVRPRRMSVLFGTAPRNKPPAKQPAPIRTEPTKVRVGRGGPS
jgi:hypothetical protein